MLLTGKVCLIAGASDLRGIGFATAELFALHGAKIVAADLVMNEKVEAGIRAAISASIGREVDLLGVRCDISSAADCDTLVERAVERFGTIDRLVNCAAIVQSRGILQIEEEDFDRTISVNLKGAFNLCKSTLRVFERQAGGAIVNVASVAAQRGGGLVGGADYAASKGGVISLTRTIAREFGPAGIRANIVCPSMTETGMLDGNVSADRYDEIVAAIPLRRAGRPVDIAGACLYLASDLSAYVTGAVVDVNGGSHIH
jgi:NAD(P)-dependent dehydrogenase (short-subunit alcohol dehydrogenase family)